MCCCSLLFTGCKKKEIMEVDNETQSVVDYAIADQEFTSVIYAAYQSGLVTKGIFHDSLILSCDTMSLVSGSRASFDPNPVYALNASGSACALVMPDGKSRTGTITMRLSSKLDHAGALAVLKLKNYTAGGVAYSCDSIILTVKEIMDGKYIGFRVKLVNGSCKTGGSTIAFRFERRMILYAAPYSGAGEEGLSLIYGESSGTNRQGRNFSAVITDGAPLVKRKACAYMAQGTLELSPEGFKPRLINFGDGICDDEATFTVNENTVAFKLK